MDASDIYAQCLSQTNNAVSHCEQVAYQWDITYGTGTGAGYGGSDSGGGGDGGWGSPDDWLGLFGGVTDLTGDIMGLFGGGKKSTSPPVAQPKQDNTALYIGLGVIGLMLLVIMLVLLKK